jgi:glycosyltransferase involved in cell wall biosynthesis
MKIAHVTATFPPYWGGTGNVVYYNALELARRGHDVHVFTAQYPLNDYSDPEEIIVHRLWTPFRIGNAPLTPALMTTLRGFDLIHLHWPFIFGAELTCIALKFWRIPYVMTYHLDLKADQKWIFGPYQSFWGPILVNGARKVLAVTLDHLRSSQVYPILRNRPEDIIEVPNGVDIKEFNPNVSGNAIRSRFSIPVNASVILFVGAMDKAHEYKGVPDLIDAFGFLNSSNAWLILAGGGELLPRYREMASQLPSPSYQQVIFIGSTAHNQLPVYFAAADFCVLPSRLPESFGMVLVEAMACGKPVIVSDSPGVRSVVTDGEDGLLVRRGDSADLVEKIHILLSDPERRQEMGQKGRANVEVKYAWPKVGERLENAYYSVVSDLLH